jgi:hypothetical protein
VLKVAVGLLGDLGVAFGNRMYQIFSQPSILQVLQDARQYEEMKSIVQWTQSVVNNIRQDKPAMYGNK